MVDWKPFDIERVTEEGRYLVTDGKSYDIATLDACGGEDAVWFLSERTSIDGMEAVTHHIMLDLPHNTNR